MTWIVTREENGKYKLTSAEGTHGMIPKGSYLTIDDKEQGCKFILRVDDSHQYSMFEPSPFIIDCGLSGFEEDRVCKNIVTAYRVKTIQEEEDALIKPIRPMSKAEISTVEEIKQAMGIKTDSRGPELFAATVFANENSILRDRNKRLVHVPLPEDLFYYQTMICGRTGGGKTVAMKYFAQYFVEKMNGAVLAINVKADDLLRMDIPSTVPNESVRQEWAELGEKEHGITNFSVYTPTDPSDIAYDHLSFRPEKICLNTRKINPDALIGAMNGITDLAANSLPGIFRKWQLDNITKSDLKMTQFITYLNQHSDDYIFDTMNENKDVFQTKLHPGTFNSILSRLTEVSNYFDVKDAICLDEEHILKPGKMSVIDVTKNVKFGALVLRDLLRLIVKAKSDRPSTPLLIIIDEVHEFYNTNASKDALGDLDTICRTGRHMKIGIVFASQNSTDMPSGLNSVVNTKFSFKSDSQFIKDLGIKIATEELECLDIGYALASIFKMPQLKVVKFPLSYGGDVHD